MNRRNIVLIGMPGAGKSTVGVILAKIIGYNFIDSDIVIQEKNNKLLKDIIAERGIEGFIQEENLVHKNMTYSNCVIATGGSVVYGSEGMQNLSQIGTIVYLKLPYDVINSRLMNIKARGVVLKPNQTLAELYNERICLYEKYADITIDEFHLDIEQTIEHILNALNE